VPAGGALPPFRHGRFRPSDFLELPGPGNLTPGPAKAATAANARPGLFFLHPAVFRKNPPMMALRKIVTPVESVLVKAGSLDPELFNALK